MSEECRLDDPTEEEMQALEKSNADKDTRIKELEGKMKRLIEISESFQELMYMDDMVKYEEEIEEIKHIRKYILGDEL